MICCIGITGGIGSGKSQTATLFQELGAALVDTDVIAHELTTAHGAAMPAIRNSFGDAVCTPEGALDRSAMRKLVFQDASQRKRLESILHPQIRATAEHRVRAATNAPYVLLAVPLLIESGSYRQLIERILVVDCPESLQVSRTMQRSQLTTETIASIMAAQCTRDQRLAAADDVIVNDRDLAYLRQQVAALHQKYLDLKSHAL